MLDEAQLRRQSMSTDRKPWVDADKLDEMFDEVHRIYVADLIEERGLVDARIERWRWDEPVIAVTWIDRDRGWIAKSLRCVANRDAASTFNVQIDAWLDEDVEPTGLGRVRRWCYDVTAAGIAVDPRLDRLRYAIKDAFERVTPLTKEDLTLTEDLSAVA